MGEGHIYMIVVGGSMGEGGMGDGSWRRRDGVWMGHVW
jgi:hypothetical protein